ncbi:ferredoxin [Mycolicibacterium iranicum]|jgi:ferredoxin|uniref:ferredoxin n=1 Tax=Mycolicibacterium iranicum TaxID=912594 RepID=UPI000463B79B|nr:ferredoxin [Mycolicibacterium iranicum]
MAASRSVQVDPQLCEAHALCIELAPNVFELGEDIATVEKSPVSDDVGDIDAAIAACPRQAISWVQH